MRFSLMPESMNQSGRGKLVVLASAQMFSDAYIEKEENGKLLDVLIQFCTTGENAPPQHGFLRFLRLN